MSRGQDTVKRKMIVAIMGTSITVLVLTCSVFIAYEYVSFRGNIVRGLATRGEIIAADSTAALAFENEADATHVLSAFRMDPDISSLPASTIAMAGCSRSTRPTRPRSPSQPFRGSAGVASKMRTSSSSFPSRRAIAGSGRVLPEVGFVGDERALSGLWWARRTRGH